MSAFVGAVSGGSIFAATSQVEVFTQSGPPESWKSCSPYALRISLFNAPVAVRPSGRERIDELLLDVWLGLTEDTSKLGRAPATHGASTAAAVPCCAKTVGNSINPNPIPATQARIAPPRTSNPQLILRRLLHVVDHNHIHRTLHRFQLQPKLLPNCREQRRPGRLVPARASRGSEASALAFVSAPRQRYVVDAGQACLVNHRPAQLARQDSHKIGNGRALGRHQSGANLYRARPMLGNRGRVRFFHCRLQLGSAFSHCQCIHRQRSSLVVHGQLEPLGQDLLEHRPAFIEAHFGQQGNVLTFHLRLDVESLPSRPDWLIDNLVVIHQVALADQVMKVEVPRYEAIRRESQLQSVAVPLARLHRNYTESRRLLRARLRKIHSLAPCNRY